MVRLTWGNCGGTINEGREMTFSDIKNLDQYKIFGGDKMKLVWENGGATVQAPKNLRSAWPNSPNQERDNHNRLHHIGRFGAWAIQEQLEQDKRDAVMNLINGWSA